MGTAERVHQLIEPLLAAEGTEVVDVEHTGGILRVTLDRPGGIDTDALSRASVTISDLLDEHDPLPGSRYVLEVSSPGIERPLRRPEHYQRSVGEMVTVKTNPDVEGERRIQGTLDEADDDGIIVAGRRLAYGDIESARTVFEWGRSEKPGKKNSSKRKATQS